MKSVSLFVLLFAAPFVASAAAERPQDTVVLDPGTVANLRLAFASAEPREFEETVFALGRVEVRPGATAAVSSRISGRVVGLSAALGDAVSTDAELVRVESRQAGDPPPVVALRAPIAGTVTDLAVHLGDPVEPASALIEIADLSSVDAVARVPEASVGRLRLGARARVRLAAFPDETFVGELVRLGAAADPETGTLAAHFRLANPEGRLRPGLRAEFAIVVSSRAEVLSVPREAVQGEGVGPRHVFVKDFELPNAFVKTPVVLGASNDRHVEIVSGVFPGDEVVTRGAYSLSFAGGGGLSLKEALDAAHGHEHAADGGELPAHGVAAKPASSAGHGHPHAERPWQIATAVLGLATLGLLIALARRRHA
jgi:membrane fusion protein, heavy metal efflux system